jgi:hypothetical protein
VLRGTQEPDLFKCVVQGGAGSWLFQNEFHSRNSGRTGSAGWLFVFVGAVGFEMARGEAIVTPERSHRVKELFPRLGVVMSFEDLFGHHFLKTGGLGLDSKQKGPHARP